MARYGMNIKLIGNLEEVKPRVVEAFKSQILGACNPRFAHRALSTDEAIGWLQPCNVVLRQDSDGVDVSIQDPEVMYSVVDDDKKQLMKGFPEEVKNALQTALAALKSPD